MNFRSGPIAGLQRPLLGRNSRGRVDAARSRTSITREIIASGQ
jgi:hypothetical protein